MPAALAALARRWIDVEPNRNVTLVVEAAASILAFAYVSLEVRHLFDPGFERAGFGAAGLELYTYSIVWLLFGVALLAVGFLRGAAALRHAGMALVCVVVAKVFLIDMAGLEGLLHISELADGKVESPEDVVKVGDAIEVKILRVDPEDRKIGLSRKRLNGADEPDEPSEEAASGNPKPRELRGGTGGAAGQLINVPESAPKSGAGRG